MEPEAVREKLERMMDTLVRLHGTHAAADMDVFGAAIAAGESPDRAWDLFCKTLDYVDVWQEMADLRMLLAGYQPKIGGSVTGGGK